MATLLPALAKTWQFSANNATPAGSFSNGHRGWMLHAKNGLIGFASSPWVVVGSGNSGSAGLDGVDRWTSIGVMTPGCWIVLKQAGIAPNFQLCWTSAESTSGFNSMYISQSAGFTGGSVGTRPTATDEVLVTASTFDTAGSAPQTHTSVAMSTDGQCTRMWMIGNTALGTENALLSHWTIIDRLQNPISELPIPWVAFSNNNGGTGMHLHALTYETFFQRTSGPCLYSRNGASNLDYSLAPAAGQTGNIAYPGNSTTLGSGLNNLSGDYLFSPIVAVCKTASHRGVHGEIADLWASSVLVPCADTYPEAAFAGPLDQFIQIGICVAHPWNNTVPLVGAGTRTRRPGRVLYFSQRYVEPEEEPAPPPVELVSELPFDTGAELGVDFDVLGDFPKNFVLVRGRRNLANAIARQLQTPEGFLAAAFDGDPDYGYDLRGQLNSAHQLEVIAGIEAKVKQKVVRDERVLSADVRAAYDLASASLSVDIGIEDAQGPFRLVLNVGEVRTEVVLQPAG
jgi:hypothetical protein